MKTLKSVGSVGSVGSVSMFDVQCWLPTRQLLIVVTGKYVENGSKPFGPRKFLFTDTWVIIDISWEGLAGLNFMAPQSTASGSCRACCDIFSLKGNRPDLFPCFAAGFATSSLCSLS